MTQTEIDRLAELAGLCRHDWQRQKEGNLNKCVCARCGDKCDEHLYCPVELEEMGIGDCTTCGPHDLPAVGSFVTFEPTLEGLLGIVERQGWNAQINAIHNPDGPYFYCANVFPYAGEEHVAHSSKPDKALSEAILKAAGE